MTDHDREKFDAIRMNLELMSHGLESMRTNMQIQQMQNEKSQVQLDTLRLSSEAQRDSIREMAGIMNNLVAVAGRHETRITSLEGRS